MKRIWVTGICASVVLCLGISPRRPFYERTDLLSDGALATQRVDSNLVNAWGLASSPSGPFWIANEGTGTSSIALADGSLVAPDVGVPSDRSGHPTGLVFNGTDGFVVEQQGASAPALFLFVTLEGRVLGWNPEVDPANAIVAVDNGPDGASYIGAALGTVDDEPFLFVNNFANGTVDVFDSSFDAAGSFTDEDVPEGYSPFGIAQIDGSLFVTFVPRDPQTGDEVAGPGNGLVDIFSTEGVLLERLATGGELNAPWGITRAPGGFGSFSQKLLVGNFGDGRILVFNQHNGRFQGQLEDEDGDPIVIEGLWGLLFGNGGDGGDEHDLYFTAGIDDEEHGLFGEIELEH